MIYIILYDTGKDNNKGTNNYQIITNVIGLDTRNLLFSIIDTCNLLLSINFLSNIGNLGLGHRKQISV